MPVLFGFDRRHRLVPRGAVVEDVRHRGERLDVVDRRGLSEQSRDRRERRLDARIAAAPLERIHQRRLFAADVGAGAAVHVNVDAVAAPHRVRAEDTGGVRLLHRRFHHAQRLGELTADVDVRDLGADRVRADRRSLDEGMRRPAHDLAILERARLGLVGVARRDSAPCRRPAS